MRLLGDCYSHAGTTRHLLHPKSPWLFFHRDHPLRYEHWSRPKRADRDTEDFADQEERLAWILALPDDDEDELGGETFMWTMDGISM